MLGCYYCQHSIQHLRCFFHSFDYLFPAINAGHLVFSVSPHIASRLSSDVLGGVRRPPRPSSPSNIAPNEEVEGPCTSLDNSAISRPITTSKPITTLSPHTFAQTSKRHTECKCGGILSFVCKVGWGYKMFIWDKQVS